MHVVPSYSHKIFQQLDSCCSSSAHHAVLQEIDTIHGLTSWPRVLAISSGLLWKLVAKFIKIKTKFSLEHVINSPLEIRNLHILIESPLSHLTRLYCQIALLFLHWTWASCLNSQPAYWYLILKIFPHLTSSFGLREAIKLVCRLFCQSCS